MLFKSYLRKPIVLAPIIIPLKLKKTIIDKKCIGMFTMKYTTMSVWHVLVFMYFDMNGNKVFWFDKRLWWNLLAGVMILSAVVNRFRLYKLTKVDKFVMSYGGLRGAVAFALVLLINPHHIKLRPMFVTTTIAVVYFTVFFQVLYLLPHVVLVKTRIWEKPWWFVCGVWGFIRSFLSRFKILIIVNILTLTWFPSGNEV